MERRDRLQSRSAPVLGSRPRAQQRTNANRLEKNGQRFVVPGLLRPRTVAPRRSPLCGLSSRRRGARREIGSCPPGDEEKSGYGIDFLHLSALMFLPSFQEEQRQKNGNQIL